LDVDSWAKLTVFLLLLVFVGGSSAAYSALLRLNWSRVRYLAAEGISRGRFLSSLLDRFGFVETTLVAANAAALAACASTAMMLLEGLPGLDTSAAIVLGALLLVTLVWVQLAFNAMGAVHPEGTLIALQWPLRVGGFLLGPLTLLLRGLTRLVLLRGKELSAVGSPTPEDDLRLIVDAAEGEGTLEEEEKEMIQSIFEMGERTAREIMVPRVDMVAVDASDPLREVLDRINAKGHSRIPIYEDTIDNVVGVVYAKDLLKHMESGSLDDPCRILARPPHFIPESKKIDELLHEMQHQKVHMAIVLDEYGGTAGLVTIEDLLEEIVGEIQDEYDAEEKPIEKLSDREAVFDALVSIHDVNETLGISLGDAEYETVGGLAYDRLGRIPVVGDEVHVDGICLKVLSVAGKRIKKVKIRVDSPGPGPRDSDG